MSDTRKLTPARLTPGRGPRSISNVRQFAVDGRKTLFLLLLLLAIPAAACSAQTAPPPPFDEYPLENVPPTAAKRLAMRFSLGAFAGRFEETPLGSIRKAVGAGTMQHQGDASGSRNWICYQHGLDRLWITSGEMGGDDHRVTAIVAQLTDKDSGPATDCENLPDKFAPLSFDGKLHLGMSRAEVVKTLGQPSKSDDAQTIYYHAGKVAKNFDETAWFRLQFRGEKLVSMRGGKSTVN